jgi:hypothetical protein
LFKNIHVFPFEKAQNMMMKNLKQRGNNPSSACKAKLEALP